MLSSEWKEKSMSLDEESETSKLLHLPSSLEFLLRHHIFLGGVMDIFMESHTWVGRYRVLACNAHYSPLEGIVFHSSEAGVSVYKGGTWIASPLTTFEFRAFYATGFTVRGKEGEVFFHATSFSTAVDQKVHVVLYPRDHPPDTNTLHIVGWQRTGQPIYNGSFVPYIVT